MCPVNSVGMMCRPAFRATFATVTSRSSISGSTCSGSGWNASQSRNTRTESNPAAAIRSKSPAVSASSNDVHHRIAVRAGQ